MVPVGHSDWLTGVSRLVRPVPVRILRCPVDRSFLIRLRRSLWSAMHRTRTPTVFPTLPSTAGTTAIGMVRQSRLRPLPFFNSYISKKKIPIDNDYGQPVSKYTTTGKYLGIGGRTFSVPQTTTNGNSQSQSSNNPVSVAEHWAKQHPNPGHQFRAVE